jgi:hypothetical protein
MNYKQIHKCLKDVGLSWVAAGEVIGCTHQHVMNVCARRVESERIAKAVSVLIEKSVSEVFPDVPRYQENRKAERKSRLDEARARLSEAGLIEAA